MRWWRRRWRRSVPIAVCLAVGVYFLSSAAPRLAIQLTGVAGTFRAEHCREAPYQAGERSLTCTGNFTAADGSFTLAAIEVDTTFEARPAGPVPVAVSGPGADTAVRRTLLVWLGPGAAGALALIHPTRAAAAALSRTRQPPAARSSPAGVRGAGFGAAPREPRARPPVRQRTPPAKLPYMTTRPTHPASPARPPHPARPPRKPMHWGADLALALLTALALAAALLIGLFYVTVDEFGLLERTDSAAGQWQGLPLTAATFTVLAVLCCVSTLTALGFRRLRAPLSTAAHGLASVLLLGMMLVMAGASYETGHPAETKPDPATTEPSRQCRSGGDSSECLGG